MQTRSRARHSPPPTSTASSPYVRRPLNRTAPSEAPGQKRSQSPSKHSSREQVVISEDDSEQSDEELCPEAAAPAAGLSNGITPACNSRQTVEGPPQPAQTAKRPDPQLLKPQSESFWAGMLIIILLGILAFVMLSPHTTRKGPSLSQHVPVDEGKVLSSRLFQEVRNLRADFPGQPEATWRAFVAAFNSISVKDPDQPAVLLVVGGNSSEAAETMQCLAKKLAAATNRLFGSSANALVHLPEVVRKRSSDEAIMEDLDGKITAILNSAHSVVLNRIQEVPPRAVLLLHGFCDNFMAPFKKALIILTAILPDGNGDAPVDSKQVDRLLHRLWDDELGLDKSASLVSRVANNPVFVQPEPNTSTCAFS